MTPDLVSVVCVSRGRPASLCRTVLALTQLYAPCFEIVVVADAQGISALEAQGYADHIKICPFDEPNIAAARNVGISHASGAIIAFIDDDAVPEPTWLDRLVAPIQDDRFDAAGGYVLGRNGISFQWKGRLVNAEAQTQPYEPGDHVPDGWAIKTEGTNMAVRADVLRALGGFDPAYAFYLDETDLNLRLSRSGYRTGLVPDALVHHGFAPSAQRRADRAPRTLFDIGRSTIVFARRHGGDRAKMVEFLKSDQRRRALRHLQTGALDPWGVARLIATLHKGLRAGADLKLETLLPLDDFDPTPKGFATLSDPMMWHSARCLRYEQRLNGLEKAGKIGKRATLICLSRTALRHRVWFHSSGVWCHTGGIYGPSIRSQKWFNFTSFLDRVAQERKRVLSVRLKD